MLACGTIGDELGRKKVMLSGVGSSAAARSCARWRRTPSAHRRAGRSWGSAQPRASRARCRCSATCTPSARAGSGRSACGRRRPGSRSPPGPVIGGVLIGVVELARASSGSTWPSALPPWSPRRSSCRRAPTPTAAAWTPRGAARRGALAALVFAIIEGEIGRVWRLEVIAPLFAAPAGARPSAGGRAVPRTRCSTCVSCAAAFTTANVVAFCTYFATFAIFFFTALYLEEVSGYSGYRIALPSCPWRRS